MKALEGSLKRLGLDYVDLYLIHAPFKVDLEKVWPILESFKEEGLSCLLPLLKLGLARNIGVSNFRILDLERILRIARHKPVVNQIEFHPYLPQDKLRSYHAEKGIITEAYGPLTPLVSKPEGPVTSVVEAIANKRDKTPAQVYLKQGLSNVGTSEMGTAERCRPCHHKQPAATTERAIQIQ